MLPFMLGTSHLTSLKQSFFDLFKAVGPVLSIRVCRDIVTRRSLGYAYVNFQNPADAERALETLNYHVIKGQPIRIMWSHRDPSLRKLGIGNVFIKNLHPSIDNQTLYDTFSQFGNILSCKVAVGSNGESRGYGFVHFESEESSRAAIEKVNGMLLKSLQVYVGPFVKRSIRTHQNAQTFTNVYIKNLKKGITEEQFSEFFVKFGQIKSKALKADGEGRPFGFADYSSHEQAAKAVDECHGKFIEEATQEEQTLYVQRFQKKSERLDEMQKRARVQRARKMHEYTGSNLYVKNLGELVNDEGLKEAFAKFGKITSAKVMMTDGSPSLSKGFGFVCFEDAESANKAISEMNGFMLGEKPLYVNVAQRKEVRQATLEVQYASRMSRLAGQVPAQQQAGMGYPPMYGPPPGAFYPPAGPSMYMYAGQPGRPGMMPGAPKWGGQPIQGMPGMVAQQMLPGQPPMMRPQGSIPQAGRRPVAGKGMAFPGRGQPLPMGKGLVKGQPLPGAQPAVAYTRQARNRDLAGGAAAPVDQPLTSSELAGMAPEQQKNALGERLFARISETQPEYAAKITGMLLEMDVTETLNLLESPDVLTEKINEALTVLKAHEGALTE
eukprot:GGOE01003166.1.p1 GENE.GGOE01003166.1~~GGOE01003166.1.p1  ORF type:complete len:609 (-),score=140.79 GGOE01003166.1:595-2421(-)